MSKIVKATILFHSINSYSLLLRIQESTEMFTKRKLLWFACQKSISFLTMG